jgi:endo-1,3(4)-beta-glucanase
LSFSQAGIPNSKLVMFARPHYTESFSPKTAAAATNLQLNTTTKGLATAVVADSWTMVENLPTTMGFAPWSPSIGDGNTKFSAASLAAILNVATSEVSQNMSEQTNLNSMYYSGKVSFPPGSDPS